MRPQVLAGGSFPVLSSRACYPSIRGPDGSEACHMAASSKADLAEPQRAHRSARRVMPCCMSPGGAGRGRASLKDRGGCSDISLWTSLPSDSATTHRANRPKAGTGTSSGGPNSWPPWPLRHWSAQGPTWRPTAPWSSSPRRQPLRRATRRKPPSRRRRHRSRDQASDGGGDPTPTCHGRNVSTKREPPSSLAGDSAWTVPPMAAASSATIARPSPDPIRRFGPRSAR